MWLKHPRKGKEDTMLTLAVWATGAGIIKFLLNGVPYCGSIDPMLLGALLGPTLGAYVARKYKDSPDE